MERKRRGCARERRRGGWRGGGVVTGVDEGLESKREKRWFGRGET